MQALGSGVGALAVAMIYYTYRDYFQAQFLKAKSLHERVAFLLWAVSEQMS
ncbi:MAG: hypothetical protein JO112_18600 [Planctomycetes bacterium]|nr:hypothetical protein [Planctomycetota bacterium]